MSLGLSRETPLVLLTKPPQLAMKSSGGCGYVIPGRSNLVVFCLREWYAVADPN